MIQRAACLRAVVYNGCRNSAIPGSYATIVGKRCNATVIRRP